MKCFVFISAFTRVASMAIGPSLDSKAVNVDLHIPDLPPTVDTSSTRGQWVSSYGYGKKDFEWDITGHWLPSGPGFLDLETLNHGYHEHLIAMHESDSWVHSSVLAVKRFLGL